MGNRAVITTPERKIGLYLHWNGGRDTIAPLLKYCEMQGYRPPSQDCYGWARMAQVIGNYFGGSCSVGIDKYTSDRQMYPGDNGIYIIKGWEIVDHLRCDYNAEGEVCGMRSFRDCEEQNRYDFDEMLRSFDECMPERLQLGAYLDAVEIPTSEVQLGDMVYMPNFEQGYEVFEVVGFGDAKVDGKTKDGVPYVAHYDHDGDYSLNGNNYITGKTCRICPRE